MSSPPLPAQPLATAALPLQPLLDAMATGQAPEPLLALALRLGADAAGARNAVCFEVTAERGLRAQHWLLDGVARPNAALGWLPLPQRALIEELAQGLRVPRLWLQALGQAGLAGEPIDEAFSEALPGFEALRTALGLDTPLHLPVVLDGTLAALLVLFLPDDRRAVLEPATAAEATLPLRLALAGRRLAGQARQQALATARADAQDAAARAGDLARANAALRLSIEKLSNQQGLTAALVAIAEAALHVVQADAGGIGLLDARGVVIIHPIDPDPATGDFRRGEPVEVVLEGTAWRWWQQLEATDSAWWVATGGDALTGLADDAQRWHAERGHRRVVHLPLRLDGEVVGFLGFCFKSAEPPPAERIETMRVLADQATLGARVARLGEAARDAALARESARRANERADLLRMTAAITQSLSGTTDLTADLPRVLGMLGVATGTDRACIFLERETDDGLQHEIIAEWVNEGLPAQQDSPAAVIPNAQLPADLVATLHAGRTSAFVVTDDPHPFMVMQRALGVSVTGACGLFVDGRYVGALAIDLCRPGARWTEAQLLAMETAAHGIGAALQQERTIARHAAALAAERQAGAEARADELARANAVLRRVNDQLAQKADPDAVLPLILAEAMRETDAVGGLLLEHDAASGTLSVRAKAAAGGGDLPLHDRPDALLPIAPVTGRDALARSPGPHLLDLAGPAAAGLAPSVREWHASRGHRMLLVAGIAQRGSLLGVLLLAFDGAGLPGDRARAMADALAQQAGLALQLGRLEQQARDTERILTAERAERDRLQAASQLNSELQRTIDVLASISDLDEFIPRALHEIAGMFGAQDCAYYEHQPDDRIVLRALFRDGTVVRGREIAALPGEAGTRLGLLAAGFRVARPAPDGGAIRSFTRPDVLDHARADHPAPERQAFALAMGWVHELNIPLVLDGRAEGALVLYRPAGRPFSADEVALAETLAKPVVLALRVGRLADEARASAVQAAVAQEEERAALAYAAELAEGNQLLEASISRLAESGVPELFLDHVLLAAASVADADETGLMLLTADRQAIALRRVFARTAPDASPAACSLGSSSPAITLEQLPAWHELKAGREVLLEPLPPALLAHWPACCRQPNRALCVPVRLGQSASGCLVLGLRGDGPVPPRRIALARAFADQAALALAFMRFATAAEEAAVAEERNRLARDIHDTLAQCLTGVIMQLQAAGALASEKPDVARECIGRAEEMARTGLAEARRSVRALRDDSDTTLDLADALRETAVRMTTGTGVTADVTVEGRPRGLSGGASMQLLRIGQEAFTNAVRHAAATRIRMSIEYTAAHVRLTVTDDGRGFTTGAGAGGPGLGFGLIGMRQRAERIGARLRIASTPAAGTTLECLLPLADAAP